MPKVLKAMAPKDPHLRTDLWNWIRMHASRRPRFARCRVEPLRGTPEVLSLWGANDCTKRLIVHGDVLRLELIPWEFQLDDEGRATISRSIEHIIAHPPNDLSMDHVGMRTYVKAEARAWLRANTKLQEAEISRFAEVVSRYTVGFGVLEHLLLEPLVEDLYIDAPAEGARVYVTLGDWNGDGSIWKCDTNIITSEEVMMSISSRLSCLSGNPFSEMDPVLETDVPYLSSRATLVGPPLSPHGKAVAFRRRSSHPWNLALMVRNGTMAPEEAAMLSILVENRASILVCGPRGSGKSSLLSALMLQIPLEQRVLVIEDTLELPVLTMRSSGFDIQSFMARDGAVGHNIDHGVAIRTSLRMGESALIIGEVRGREAKALYQAMRAGRSGSCVMGTAHGDSAQSVMNRMIHDLEVDAASFTTTDVVITMSLDDNGEGRRSRKVKSIESVIEGPPISFTDLEIPSLNDGLIALTNESLGNLMERLAARCGRASKDLERDISYRVAFFREIQGLDDVLAQALCSIHWYLHMNGILQNLPSNDVSIVHDLIHSTSVRVPLDV